MTIPPSWLAIDLGASSGRAIIGSIENSRIQLNEIHRFDNKPLTFLDGLHWNVLSIYQETLLSIEKACQLHQNVTSLGIDAWGLDYALVDEKGSLLEIPFHYRDKRTQGMMQKAFQQINREEIFYTTGIQFMEINTIFQLYAQVENQSTSIKNAARLLTIPDLFNYWFSGVQICEYTEAITTQCFNPLGKDWAWNVIEALGIPKRIFGPVVMPGIILGDLTSELIDNYDIPPIKIISTASHDTASAVVAIPAREQNFVYISSGTWSLIGTEVNDPVINENSLELNFTNEAGAENRFLFMKNITGLWLLQECQRHWVKNGIKLDIQELMVVAERAKPFQAMIHPNDPVFVTPGDIQERISRRCLETGQNPPHTPGEFGRCILESLAFAYKHIITQIESCVNRNFDVIHIIGGGSKNELLNQMTANSTGKIVVAGPVEATSLGNIVMQLIAQGVISNLDEARRLIRDSFPLIQYEPTDTPIWEEAYFRWRNLWGNIGQ